MPENYYNVKEILNQLNVEALEFTMSADIKMRKWIYEVFLNSLKLIVLVMILVGKSAGKPFHGCPFCSASTPYVDSCTHLEIYLIYIRYSDIYFLED